MNRREAVTWLLGLLALHTAQAGSNGHMAGRGVAEVLAETGTASLHFLYSSQLLPATLRVAQEPTGSTPLAIAREILAPHHLTLTAVAPDVYAVAAATPATQTPAAVAAGTVPAPGLADAAAVPAFETQITGERYPYGLKRSDDSLLYSAARLGATPSLGEDALYALSRQPGLSQGDLSGRLNIRGGGPNETLILMDGFPIREAYHMPGYRGVLSVIDPAMLSEVSLYSGAIPARYGDRMSGVLELRSLQSDEGSRHSLGAGFLNARARSVLPIGQTDGDLLLDVRYGATGYLLQALQPAASKPHYGDLFTRLRLHAGEHSEITFNVLKAQDSLAVHRNGLQETSHLSSDLGYYWLHTTTSLPLHGEDEAKLSVWLGNSQIDTQRSGQLDSPGFAIGQLQERRYASLWDLRTELQWPWHEAHVLDAGLDFGHGNARYRYDSAVRYGAGIATALGVPDTNEQSFDLQPRRNSGSLHISDSWLVLPGLTAQLGLRASRFETPDAGDLTNWDPRTSLSWQAWPRTTLRAAWGRVHQVSDLSEIVPGRDLNGRLISQQSEYVVLGVDQALAHTLLLRVEAFQKDQLHLLPLQRNLLRTPSILPELSLDRVWLAPRGARIRGIEFNLQQSALDWHWGAAYALSNASESYAQGRMARSGDQRHAASLTLDWTRSNWLAGGALNYRSGLPTTTYASDGNGGLVIGRRNANRLPGTLGLDLRVKWHHPLPRGNLAVTGQVSNLLGGDGNCCSELAASSRDGTPQVRLKRDGSLPPIPWAGISWDF
jgi:outer membrane receptor protein involved in Fe transport